MNYGNFTRLIPPTEFQKLSEDMLKRKPVSYCLLGIKPHTVYKDGQATDLIDGYIYTVFYTNDYGTKYHFDVFVPSKKPIVELNTNTWSLQVTFPKGWIGAFTKYEYPKGSGKWHETFKATADSIQLYSPQLENTEFGSGVFAEGK